MNKEYAHFLAFDCGATSCRGVLGTFADGRMNAKEVCRFPNQTLELGGRHYWNVYGIYEHIVECLALLGREGVRLDSIGIDTWGVDFGLLGEDGTLLSLPRAYRDPYTAGIPERVFSIIPREELYAFTGIQTMDFNEADWRHGLSACPASAFYARPAVVYADGQDGMRIHRGLHVGFGQCPHPPD